MRAYTALMMRRMFIAVTGITPVSMQSNLKHSEEVFYNRLTTTVTASWLEIEQSSYAIRHLRKLTRYIVAPPRIEAGIVFIISILLTIWQVFRILDDTASTPLNWFLLILCIVLLIGSSFICFCMASVYRLDVVLANETKPLKILCATRADLDSLNDALLQAMDYYRDHPEPGPHYDSDKPGGDDRSELLT